MDVLPLPPVAPAPRLPTVARWAGEIVLVALVGLVAGGLTSFGQSVLPAGIAPLANSATPWVAVVGLLLWRLAPPLPRAAVLGAIGLSAINSGYGVVSTVRGYFYDPTSWNLIALIVGPLLGIAVALTRSPSPLRTGLASGALAAVPLGEGLHGLLVVAQTATTAYWSVVCVLAVGVLAVVGLPRRGRFLIGAVLALTTLAALLLAAYLLYTAALASTF